MTKRNRNRIKYNQVDSDGSEIKRFVIILVVLLIIVGVIYLLTEKFKTNNITTNKEKVSISYDKLTIGTLFSVDYDNYYALIYSSKDVNALKYASLISRYNQQTDHKKIYFIDLNDSFNSIYYNIGNDNKSNPNAKDIDSLDLGDLTLIEINNKKIVNYLEDYNKISKYLIK